MCQKYGMGVLSWSPLAGGWLSGRFGTGKDNTSRRAAALPARYDMGDPTNQRKLAAVDGLAELAGKIGCSLPELAVAFVLAHPAVTSAIIGPRTMEQFLGLLKAPEVLLDGAAFGPDRRDSPAWPQLQPVRQRLGAALGRRRQAAPPARLDAWPAGPSQPPTAAATSTAAACSLRGMIDRTVKELAKGRNFAALTTLLPGGQPMTHVMWVDADDDHVLINTGLHRQKYLNVTPRPAGHRDLDGRCQSLPLR